MKEVGNAFFKQGQYAQAVEAYSSAIELSQHSNAAYFSNRYRERASERKKEIIHIALCGVLLQVCLLHGLEGLPGRSGRCRGVSQDKAGLVEGLLPPRHCPTGVESVRRRSGTYHLSADID
jgi:hypothetical protein